MTYAMPLSQLLATVSLDSEHDVQISGLSIDSREVKAGDLFIAYPGTATDGRNFIEAAQSAGAAAVVYQAGEFELPAGVNIPCYSANDVQHMVGELAHHFYRAPSEELQVFGVTGTNGKTTCCYLLTQALTVLGMQAAMIGTIGAGKLAALNKSATTTPDPISVHRLLAEFRDQGITQVCMEVSSHALDQGRVAGVNFFCTLFTNLSHDHLDYHGSLENYAAAKRKLFTAFYSELVITNADDELGLGLIDIANAGFIASYSEHCDQGDVALDSVELRQDGLILEIAASGADFQVQTPLIGKVNIPNVLMLVTTLLALSTSIEDIQAIVAKLEPAPGRMELHTAKDLPRVVIDYAHTPDALEKALLSVKEHCSGDLWCVFGCGGDRDAAKRPVMGAAADQLADKVIVTNDNPRSESPELIAEQIVTGIKGDYQVVLNRALAIKTAIEQASANDWVLVAGKGHETTQEIAGEILNFSDREQVSTCLGAVA